MRLAIGPWPVPAAVGPPPTSTRSPHQSFRAALGGSDAFGAWEALSNDCRNFIQALLAVKPEFRLSAEEALQHQWLGDQKEDQQPQGVDQEQQRQQQAEEEEQVEEEVDNEEEEEEPTRKETSQP
eukprot:GHVT01039386.1.p4 GENE.GHVT01039386.1~~GHVT01039386.1.p4  ORF type:complete len:125 (+),score=39.85 GHVT01039386.1:291-665(+)